MKKLVVILALGIALLGQSSASLAQDIAASAPLVETSAPTAVEVAPALATVDAAIEPIALTPNKGDVAWMLAATALVVMMTLPGLALFYGGLVRGKNMLSVLMQVMVTFSMIVVLWCLYGYSLAFSAGNAFVGGTDRFFMQGLFDARTGEFAMTHTFSKGVVIPEVLFAAFQAAFAGITCCLIVGAFAERIKFSAVLMFMALWFTFSYAPIAHMMWFWMGADAYSSPDLVDAMNAKAGYLWNMGAIDFAGGHVVHINAAVAALVGAFMVGKRVGYGREAMVPHSLPLTMIGAAMLWVGWFGFNAGSMREANNMAALAFMNTFAAAAAAVLAWCLGETMMRGKASMLGVASGALAGLVTVTSGAGDVGLMGAVVTGFIGGFACLWGVNGLKRVLRVDDSLDVFGIHGVGGIVGALLVGVFNHQDLGGTGQVLDWVNVTVGSRDISTQVWLQLKSVVVTILWSGVVAAVAFKIVDMTIGLRVSEGQEREGLDISSHGGTAYSR